MKKSLLTLLFILSINTVFAQYAYQNILNTIEANSTVLAAHHKQMEANIHLITSSVQEHQLVVG